LTRLFGFVQLDLPGSLAVSDGRYVLRDEGGERVLVIETLGAPPPARRRRRKSKEAPADEAPAELPLTRITLVRAFEAFDDGQRARAWLDSTLADEDALDRVLSDAIGDLNRALHAQAISVGDPYPQAVTANRATATRIGYGNGEELADSMFTFAQAVDPTRGPASRRRARTEELRPQQRLAAVLGGREQLDACETLLLRARADLNANRPREAALQLRIGLEALLAELDGALDDPGHSEDMAKLSARRESTAKLADSALNGDLSPEQLQLLSDLLATSERVLRRRRVLGD
jgi:hypothetical protein